MTNRTFSKGDTVFDIHGRQGAYIASYGGHHLVAPEYEGGDYGEPSWGAPEQWDQIFLNPPTQKLEAKVDELDKLITEKRAELKRINAEFDQAARQHQERMKKFKQHQALQRIEDYIDGKFTHFLHVSDYYGPKIITKDEALDQNDRWDRKLKLLCLFGDTKGDLQWKINRYRDGSGNSWDEVYPVSSEEEAIAIARRLFSDAVAEWREQEKKHYGTAVNWARRNERGWLEVPDDLRKYLQELELSAKRGAIETARQALEKAQAELAALTTEAA